MPALLDRYGGGGGWQQLREFQECRKLPPTPARSRLPTAEQRARPPRPPRPPRGPVNLPGIRGPARTDSLAAIQEASRKCAESLSRAKSMPGRLPPIGTLEPATDSRACERRSTALESNYKRAEGQRAKTKAEVDRVMGIAARLKEMPPEQALRHALLVRYGSLSEIWKVFDTNASGELSMQEFSDGIERSKIPWREVTGIPSIKQLFKLFDADNSHTLDLVEFLGFPEVEVEMQRALADGVEVDEDVLQWKKYVNTVNLTPLSLFRRAMWTCGGRKRKKTSGPLSAAAKEFFRQDPAEARIEQRHLLNGQIRRIDVRVRDLTSQRAELGKIRQALHEVARESLVERTTRLAEAERARKSAILHSLGSLTVERADTELDLVHAFGDHHLPEAELELRKLAKKHRIPLIDATHVKEKFLVYDEDHSGSIDREEFHAVVRDLLCVGKAKDVELPARVVDKWWRTLDLASVGYVNFEAFMCWYYFQCDMKGNVRGK